MRREQSLALSLAWHVAAMQRTKRLPSLSSLLARLKPRKHESIEQRRDEFEELKAKMLKGKLPWRVKPS